MPNYINYWNPLNNKTTVYKNRSNNWNPLTNHFNINFLKLKPKNKSLDNMFLKISYS